MSKKTTLEDRMYTAEEVEEIVRENLNSFRNEVRENKIKLETHIEKSRILNVMIGLDVSVDLIDKVVNEPEKEPVYNLNFIREQKYFYWQQQGKEFQ